LKKLVGYVGILVFIVVFIGGFLAYFVTSIDPQTRLMHDGVGRPLSESPFFMRLIFGQERLWVGWRWFIADLIIFWGGIGLGVSLSKYGFKD